MLLIEFVPVGVPAPIVTGTVMGLPAEPAAIAVVDVQTTLAPDDVPQLHPVPVGVDEIVRFDGSVSVTVTVPDVGTPPLFETVMVYCAPL